MRWLGLVLLLCLAVVAEARTPYQVDKAEQERRMAAGLPQNPGSCPTNQVVTGMTRTGTLACAATPGISYGAGDPPGTCVVNDLYAQTATTLRWCFCRAANQWTCAPASDI